MEDVVIGIDLGTTNSCVSVFLDGKVEILENSDGGRITPSFIFFTDSGEIGVGEHAKDMSNMRPECGISEVKRLVGRAFDDPYIQNNLKYLPFKVESDKFNNPVVVINQSNRVMKKSPQELCAIILQKLKRDVESKFGQVVNKVVITVPAYFNVTQREVTLAAAKDTGFTVLKLLNEPTAAALSYYFEVDSSELNYSLVYDLGGGTFDVAILKQTSDNIEIISVDGDTQLGGHDLDNLIVDHVCEELTKQYDYNPKNNPEDLRLLQDLCEKAKKKLSTYEKTPIVLPHFVPNNPRVQIDLTRLQFENLAEELFQRTMSIVDNCLRGSKLPKKKIREVLLSGGSTRIPKIQTMLSKYFNEKVLNKLVNPDECVAKGAALQGAMLSKSGKQKIKKIYLTDVIPLSLGISDFVYRMEFLIKRNSPIPAQGSATRFTTRDRQRNMLFRIYEGERLNSMKNRFLGDTTITKITPAPPGECKVLLTMTVDENGILSVTAQEECTHNLKELQIEYTRGNQSESEITNTVLDAEKCKEEDECFRRFAKLKIYLLTYCTRMKYYLELRQLRNAYEAVYEMCGTIRKRARNMEMEEEDELKTLIERIKIQCEPIAKYYNFELMLKVDFDNNK